MPIIQGNIPEKITYIYSQTSKVVVGCEWDSDWKDPNFEDSKIEVTPAFPADTVNPKSIATGESWARSWRMTKQEPIQHKEIENKGITDIRVIRLDKRAKGGRAYKVIADGFYVDLREDVLIDAMLKTGVKEEGILQGKFIWARIGSEMKLIREGSAIHKKVLSFMDRKALTKIKNSELEVGGIYTGLKKDKVVFLGFVDTYIYKDLDLQTKQTNWRDAKATFNYSKEKQKNLMLFADITYNEKALFGENFFNLNFRKSQSYLEKVGIFDLGEDHLKAIRTRAKENANKQILQYAAKKLVTQASIDDHITYNSQYLNVHKAGEDFEPYDIKKFIPFT